MVNIGMLLAAYSILSPARARPDIAVSVSILSAYNAAPTVAHLEALLRVLAYLKGTHTLGLAVFKGSGTISMKSIPFLALHKACIWRKSLLKPSIRVSILG